MRILNYLAVFVMATLAASCAQEPTIDTGPDAEVILDRLHRVQNARVRQAFVDPNVDFGQFTSVLIDPLNVSDVDIQQPDRGASGRGKWELTETDQERLQQAFAESMRREFEERGQYSVVTEPGDEVLRISAALTGLAPSASQDSSRNRTSGRTRVYTEGAGSVAVSVVLMDSQSGEPLAVMKDVRRAGTTWGRNNSVSNMSDVRLVFNSWARTLRARLDLFHD